jgi:hypothetical protein
MATYLCKYTWKKEVMKRTDPFIFPGLCLCVHYWIGKIHIPIFLHKGVFRLAALQLWKREAVPLTVLSCNINRKNSVTFNMPPIQSKL